MESRVLLLNKLQVVNKLFVLVGLTFSFLTSSCELVSYSHSVADEVNIPNIEILEREFRLSFRKNGMLCLDSVPFSGFLIQKHANGQVASRKGYHQGKLEGHWRKFYADGSLKSIRYYQKGEKQGKHLGYHPSGTRKFKYYFENGLSEGTHFTWYADGQLSSETNYTNGHELGAQKVWRPDGKFKSNYVVRENGRRYGMIGVKRCAKIDSETKNIDPYKGTLK